MNTMDDFFSRNFVQQPYYVWFGPNESYRVVSVHGRTVTLQSGSFLAPIPLHHRKNRNVDLCALYPDYSPEFIRLVRTRKDSSEVVHWKPVDTVLRMNYNTMINRRNEYIAEQPWKCRYCGTINQGGFQCNGKRTMPFPVGGPNKTTHNVLLEYNYFLTKSTCLPVLKPFHAEPQTSWINVPTVPSYCGAHRCVHESHLNQSDQVLSFPRQRWTPAYGVVSNTSQFFLPGAMLGHHISGCEHQCTKCRTVIALPKTVQNRRNNVEHLWWVMETLYWLKVDIYNKKMQKLTPLNADKRYNAIKHVVGTLNADEFVYYGTVGDYQTNTFQNVIRPLVHWIADKRNYDARFDYKNQRYTAQ